MGSVNVDKNQIWDNRYNAGEEVVATDSKGKKMPSFDGTLFKGMRNIQPGMLLKQIK